MSILKNELTGDDAKSESQNHHINDLNNRNNAEVPAVVVESLLFSYVASKPIIDIKTWQLGKSEQVFLYGPSGCGKSTLLNLISGILSPQGGKVSVLGTDIASLKTSKRDRFRAQHIGVVFQQFNLVPYLSVLDNIQLAMHFANDDSDKTDAMKKESTKQQRIASMLRALQLPSDCILQKASELSVGQQQRVAIARALINKPDVLIVDEPTSALDAAAKDAFMQVLTDTAISSNAALIFVSHDQSLARHFQRIESLTDINHTATAMLEPESRT